ELNNFDHYKTNIACLKDLNIHPVRVTHNSSSSLIRHLRCVHKLNTFKSKEKLVNRSTTKESHYN
ncbi:unnamed protein product, partial [Rotaria sordida]